MSAAAHELEVRDWLAHWRLSKYADLLLEHDIDSLDVICHLTEADLTEIGIEKVGAKRRFLTAIAHEGRVQGVKRSFDLSNSGTSSVAVAHESGSPSRTQSSALNDTNDISLIQMGPDIVERRELAHSEVQQAFGYPKHESIDSASERREIEPIPMITSPAVRGNAMSKSISENTLRSSKEWTRTGAPSLPAISKPTNFSSTAASPPTPPALTGKPPRHLEPIKADGSGPHTPNADQADSQGNSRRSSFGQELQTSNEVAENVINCWQGLIKSSDGSEAPRSPRTMMKEKRIGGEAFLDAQKKFMEVAKRRAASQEKFLVEAEDMKGKVMGGDLFGVIRKFIKASPLLVNQRSNLMGSLHRRPHSSLGHDIDVDQNLSIIGADGQLASPSFSFNSSLSRNNRLAKLNGDSSPSGLAARCKSTPPVLQHNMEIDTAAAQKCSGWSPIRPPANRGSKPNYQVLLAEQEKSMISLHEHDQGYKKVMDHFASTEDRAFGRLMNIEDVAYGTV
mmetsp:Transcript_38322/g.68459  ORF Transcript_38322/g.68459 Transcript_38322/m.68459 type:complete len:508 (-) Transcript_38322:1593-3116(-)